MEKRFYLQLLLFVCISVIGQNVAPYVDKSGNFKVFDNGNTYVLENGEVTEVHIGGNYLIYTDSKGQVKRYANGETENLTTDEHTEFYVTQYLAAIVEGEDGEILKVRYENDEELLSLDMDKGTFAIGSNNIAFRDNFGDFSIFYNGEQFNFSKAKDYEAFGNTVAFFDSNNSICLFSDGKKEEVYSGKIKRELHHSGDYDMIHIVNLSEENPSRYKAKTQKLLLKVFRAQEVLLKEPNKINYRFFLKDSDIAENPQKRSFKSTKSKKKEYEKVVCFKLNQWDVGHNLIALVNEEDNLVVIDRQDLRTMNHQPKKMKVGYNTVSFIDGERKFYAYWNGEITELTPRVPKFESLVGNTVTYVDDLGFFHVFDKGRHTALEAYEPLLVAISDEIVAYTDSDGHLKAYYEGKKIQISNQTITNFQLIGRVLFYSNSRSEVKIFYAGEHYSG